MSGIVDKIRNKFRGYGQLDTTKEERLARVHAAVESQAQRENTIRDRTDETQHLLLHTSDVASSTDTAASVASTGRQMAGGIVSAQSALSHAATVASPIAHIAASAASVVPSPVAPVMHAVNTVRHAHLAVDAYSQIGRVKQVKNDTDDPEIEEMCDYAIGQANSRLARHGLAAIVGGIPTTIYAGQQALTKMNAGTKGVERATYAEDLWERQQAGDPDAEDLCAATMGVDEFAKYSNTVDGHEKLAESLKST